MGLTTMYLANRLCIYENLGFLAPRTIRVQRFHTFGTNCVSSLVGFSNDHGELARGGVTPIRNWYGRCIVVLGRTILELSLLQLENETTSVKLDHP